MFFAFLHYPEGIEKRACIFYIGLCCQHSIDTYSSVLDKLPRLPF